MKNYVQILFLSLIIISCNQKTEKNEVQIPIDKISEIKTETQPEKKLIQEKQMDIETEEEKGGIEIKFEDFRISIDSVFISNNQGELNKIQKDTVIVYLEIGETIEGVILKITQTKFDDIKIFQKFENSVTIMDEGPHCDLTEWNHYYSDWQQLKQIKNDEYLTDSYSETDWEKFDSIDIKDLIKAVRAKCGDRWAEHIKNIKSPTEYPSGISTSRIFIKILLKQTKTKEEQEKIISFEIPMGC